jgi:hypothetical protein
MIFAIILLAFICAAITFENIYSSSTYKKLTKLINSGKIIATDNKEGKYDKISEHNDILVGDKLVDIIVKKENWYHYCAYNIFAGENETLVVRYIVNTKSKSVNTYIQLKNIKEAKAILKCMFRVVKARNENSKIKINSIAKKQKAEILNDTKVN